MRNVIVTFGIFCVSCCVLKAHDDRGRMQPQNEVDQRQYMQSYYNDYFVADNTANRKKSGFYWKCSNRVECKFYTNALHAGGEVLFGRLLKDNTPIFYKSWDHKPAKAPQCPITHASETWKLGYGVNLWKQWTDCYKLMVRFISFSHTFHKKGFNSAGSIVPLRMAYGVVPNDLPLHGRICYAKIKNSIRFMHLSAKFEVEFLRRSAMTFKGYFNFPTFLSIGNDLSSSYAEKDLYYRGRKVDIFETVGIKGLGGGGGIAVSSFRCGPCSDLSIMVGMGLYAADVEHGRVEENYDVFFNKATRLYLKQKSKEIIPYKEFRIMASFVAPSCLSTKIKVVVGVDNIVFVRIPDFLYLLGGESSPSKNVKNIPNTINCGFAGATLAVFYSF